MSIQSHLCELNFITQLEVIKTRISVHKILEVIKTDKQVEVIKPIYQNLSLVIRNPSVNQLTSLKSFPIFVTKDQRKDQPQLMIS